MSTERRPPAWRPEAWGGALVAVVRTEAAAGFTLAVGAAVALIWANSPLHASYDSVWQHRVAWFPLPAGVPPTVRSVINDALMTVFFLGVGLEIARERTVGALKSLRNAVLPVVAALAGMGGAALVYLITVAAAGAGSQVRSGWGIPMATDVAFALGALAVLGRRVPRELRVFVLALAVADDVASVVVLAVVASTQVNPAPLIGALALLLGLALLRRRAATAPLDRPSIARSVASSPWTYGVAVIAEWLLLSAASIEPALAGVFVGVMVPAHHLPGQTVERTPPKRSEPARTLLPTSLRTERVVLPVSTAFVLPLFALANTGVEITPTLWAPGAHRTVLVAVIAARVVGKLVGIGGACALLIALGATRMPDNVRPAQLAGVAMLCGIGFTVPLLFADAEFRSAPGLIHAADAGLLVGSLIAFALGSLWLLALNRSQRRLAASQGDSAGRDSGATSAAPE